MIYEKIVKGFSFIPWPVPEKIKKRVKEEIEFSHLDIRAEDAFRAAINLPFLILVFFLILLFLKLIDFGFFLIFTFLSVILFYFLFNYTKFYSFYYRSKASSEMVLSILYMSIALSVRPNLENALSYAAKNLTGPLGKDFKKGVYELYSRKKLSAAEVLDEIGKKWKIESEEFVRALELLKGSLTSKERKKNLKRALELVINGTRERMETYAYKMKTPLTLITLFGITLPLMALITFPILFLFVPELASPQHVVILYNLILPFIVYILLFQNLFRRPFSFHQPIFGEVKKIKEIKKKIKLLTSILFVTFFAIPIFYFLKSELLIFSESQFLFSLASIFLFSSPLIFYNFFVHKKLLEISVKVTGAENELPQALDILASDLKLGLPIEKVFESSYKKLEGTKVRELFKKIVENIKFGFNLEQAIFDKKIGAILAFPSRIIKMVMRVIADVAKEGPAYLASALESISVYLKDAQSLELKTKEVLSEIVHDIKMHALVVAPITAGIIVGLTIFVLSLFFAFQGSFQQLNKFFGEYGVIGNIVSFGFFNLLNISRLLPASIFQLIVGIYLLELTLLLSFFYNEIVFGEDETQRKENTAKTLFLTISLYIITVLIIYFSIKSFINIEELVRMI